MEIPEYNEEELQSLSKSEADKIVGLWTVEYLIAITTGFLAIQVKRLGLEDALLAALSLAVGSHVLWKKNEMRRHIRKKIWNLLCQNPNEYQQFIEKAKRSENSKVASGAEELDDLFKKRLQKLRQEIQEIDKNNL